MGLRPILLTAFVCVALAAPGGASQAAPAAGAAPAVRLDPDELDRSLDLGTAFLLKAQRADGSIAYEISAERGTDLGTRHATREMGGLWALTCLHRRNPTKETADAILKAFRHHAGHAKRTPTGGRYLCEPLAVAGSTNAMAIHVLALQDFLGADYEFDPAVRAGLERDLADSVKFLVSLRMPAGRFYSEYRCADGRGAGPPEPYSDGECLLALARAAKSNGGDAALRDTVLESAAVMYGEYVRSALRADPLSDQAKGFYQWGSMSFYELYTSGWPGTQPYAARAIAMARWMTDVAGIDGKNYNNGYAFEGLAVAWKLARLTKDAKNQKYLGAAIERQFNKLLTLQLGSPRIDPSVPASIRQNRSTQGAVLTAAKEPTLRIDVTQHQLHATLLIRHLMFREPDEPNEPGTAAAGAAR